MILSVFYPEHVLASKDAHISVFGCNNLERVRPFGCTQKKKSIRNAVNIAEKYNSCHNNFFCFVYCESFSGFGTESGVAKWRKARFCKDNVMHTQSWNNATLRHKRNATLRMSANRYTSWHAGCSILARWQDYYLFAVSRFSVHSRNHQQQEKNASPRSS